MVCTGCGREVIVAGNIGYCAECLRRGNEEALESAENVHTQSRRNFPVPGAVPCDEDGIECTRCINGCLVGDGGRGFCGVRRMSSGRLTGGNASDGFVRWYLDPLPTNCVADWICPAGTGAGYPSFSHQEGPEFGYHNLAVYYLGCTFNCLFCQNWQCRDVDEVSAPVTAETLASAAGDRVSCICYFGGDPTPQIPHALAAARKAREGRSDGILRICWETNGSMDPDLLRQMLDISLESGGCVKFDIKAWDGNIHRALTGAGNKRVLENIDLIAARIGERPVPPLFAASTLLVPGYVDAEEVSAIASFLAGYSPDIPYSLLAFYPQFALGDLPTTSRDQAQRCKAAARAAGLTNVRIGNQHLLR